MSDKFTKITSGICLIVACLMVYLQTHEYMFGIDEHTIVTLDSGVDGGNQRGRLWVTMNVTMTGLRCENLAFRAFNKFGQTDTHNLNNFAHMTFVNTDARGNSLYTIQREMEQKPNTLGFEGVDHHGPLAYVASGR